MTHRGSCICGAVTFSVEGSLVPAVACHCLQCRKGSGHFDVATAAPVEAISVTGDVKWYAFKPGVARGFCGTCGAQLFQRGEGAAEMSIQMGAFDTRTGLTITGHIFAAEKGDYYDLPDDVPISEGA